MSEDEARATKGNAAKAPRPKSVLQASSKPKKVKRPRTEAEKKARRTGNPTGRPTEINSTVSIKRGKKRFGAIELIEKLAGIGCPKSEIAAAFSVDPKTLDKFLRDNPKAQQAYDDGLHNGKALQRESLRALANKNGAVAIFLAMNTLGMKDLRQQWAWNPNLGGKDQSQQTRTTIIKGGLPDQKTLAEQEEILAKTPMDGIDEPMYSAEVIPIPQKKEGGEAA